MTEQEIKDYIAEQEMISENGIILPPSQRNLFIQVPIDFIRDGNLTVTEKMVYMYIWTYGITTKVGHPSQDRMSKDLGVSKPTLRRIMDGLEKKNALLRITRFYYGTKEKTTSLYYLNEITTDGTFSKTYLNPVKNLYKDRKTYIPKPIYK